MKKIMFLLLMALMLAIGCGEKPISPEARINNARAKAWQERADFRGKHPPKRYAWGILQALTLASASSLWVAVAHRRNKLFLFIDG